MKTKGFEVSLLALGSELESDLARALAPVCSEIHTVESIPAGANVVFCPSNIDIVKSLRAADPARTIIVVSRHPEVTDWLDSLESGADDYCAAPFESSQLLWILQSSRRTTGQLAA